MKDIVNFCLETAFLQSQCYPKALYNSEPWYIGREKKSEKNTTISTVLWKRCIRNSGPFSEIKESFFSKGHSWCLL